MGTHWTNQEACISNSDTKMDLMRLYGTLWDIKVAERVGFEPTIHTRQIPVFETGAFVRSAISPAGRIIHVTARLFRNQSDARIAGQINRRNRPR